ncbi:MAG: flagellar basal body P-ring formation chaperone FlgA [Aquabacterium sp.]|nr:flagellar basal body P-ring formation chaperone FlgA [Aquabacterium sp.]
MNRRAATARAWRGALVGGAAAVLGLAVLAQPAVRVAEWQLLVERHVLQHNAAAPWRTVVEWPTDGAAPPACQQPLRVVDVSRSRWLGPLALTLSCDKPAWRWSVMVRVRGMASVVQASRAVPAGRRLGADDLQQTEVDLANEPPGVVLDMAQALGRETARPLRENTSLLLNALRAPTVIQTGERVTVQVQGRSFQISIEGTAQQGGAVGDTIRVKLADGKLVSAQVLRAGQAEVRM